MTYQLTIKYADGSTRRQTAIGALSALCDALYDAGAMGITAVVKP